MKGLLIRMYASHLARPYPLLKTEWPPETESLTKFAAARRAPGYIHSFARSPDTVCLMNGRLEIEVYRGLTIWQIFRSFFYVIGSFYIIGQNKKEVDFVFKTRPELKYFESTKHCIYQFVDKINTS